MTVKQDAQREGMQKFMDLERQNIAERKKSQLKKARTMQRTASNSLQRKADNAAIEDYLSRNPPKVW